MAISACGVFGDPEVIRVCECELLEKWTTGLPVLPGGDTYENGVVISETEDEFSISVERSPLAVDDIHQQRIIDAFAQSGLNYDLRSDTEVRWEVAIYPGTEASFDPWLVRFVSLDGMTLQVIVTVDGAEWGIKTFEQLDQLYLDDREQALEIQEERQQAAIDLLEPFHQAAISLAEEY
jgi:hypothetical protein